jgi:GNAT superfamily N-acetyltransferase
MKAQPLTSEKVDQAYALVQLVTPQISLEAWRDFAGSLISPFEAPESGILAIEDERKYILGLVGYVVDHDLEHGQTLIAKNFIAFDATEKRRKEIAFALIKAMEDLARDKRCGAIRTIVHEPEDALRNAWIIEVLKHSGHHTEARRFIKAVATTG